MLRTEGTRQLGTKGMTTPGGATSNRLDRLNAAHEWLEFLFLEKKPHLKCHHANAFVNSKR